MIKMGRVELGLALLTWAVAPLAGRADAPEQPLQNALATTAARPPVPAQRRFAKLVPGEVAGRTYYPYSFDGHVHTEHSPDADHPPAMVLAAAEREGLDALVITDHGSAAAKLGFAKFKGKITPLVGQEIGGPFGHAVFWNVDVKQEVDPSRTSLAERAAFAHAHGGLIVLCHPGWWIQGREEDPMHWISAQALQPDGLSGTIDAIELWNGVYDAPLRKLITAWEDAMEAGVFVPIVGNSDFHRLGSHRLGGPRNVAYCDQPEPATCLWSAVKAGRLYVTDGPSLLLTVNDVMTGGSVEVAPSEGLQVHVRAEAPRGGELRLFQGRSVVQTLTLAPGQPADATFRWSGPSADSYVRAEIVKSPGVPGAGNVELLSNPVRVRLRH